MLLSISLVSFALSLVPHPALTPLKSPHFSPCPSYSSQESASIPSFLLPVQLTPVICSVPTLHFHTSVWVLRWHCTLSALFSYSVPNTFTPVHSTLYTQSTEHCIYQYLTQMLQSTLIVRLIAIWKHSYFTTTPNKSLQAWASA